MDFRLPQDINPFQKFFPDKLKREHTSEKIAKKTALVKAYVKKQDQEIALRKKSIFLQIPCKGKTALEKTAQMICSSTSAFFQEGSFTHGITFTTAALINGSFSCLGAGLDSCTKEKILFDIQLHSPSSENFTKQTLPKIAKIIPPILGGFLKRKFSKALPLENPEGLEFLEEQVQNILLIITSRLAFYEDQNSDASFIEDFIRSVLEIRKEINSYEKMRKINDLSNSLLEILVGKNAEAIPVPIPFQNWASKIQTSISKKLKRNLSIIIHLLSAKRAKIPEERQYVKFGELFIQKIFHLLTTPIHQNEIARKLSQIYNSKLPNKLKNQKDLSEHVETTIIFLLKEFFPNELNAFSKEENKAFVYLQSLLKKRLLDFFLYTLANLKNFLSTPEKAQVLIELSSNLLQKNQEIVLENNAFLKGNLILERDLLIKAYFEEISSVFFENDPKQVLLTLFFNEGVEEIPFNEKLYSFLENLLKTFTKYDKPNIEPLEQLQDDLRKNLGHKEIGFVVCKGLSTFVKNSLFGEDSPENFKYLVNNMQGTVFQYLRKDPLFQELPFPNEEHTSTIAIQLREVIGRRGRENLRRVMNQFIFPTLVLAMKNVTTPLVQNQAKSPIVDNEMFCSLFQKTSKVIHVHLENFSKNKPPHRISDFDRDLFFQKISKGFLRKAFPEGSKDLFVPKSLQEPLWEALYKSILPSLMESNFSEALDSGNIDELLINSLSNFPRLDISPPFSKSYLYGCFHILFNPFKILLKEVKELFFSLERHEEERSYREEIRQSLLKFQLSHGPLGKIPMNLVKILFPKSRIILTPQISNILSEIILQSLNEKITHALKGESLITLTEKGLTLLDREFIQQNLTGELQAEKTIQEKNALKKRAKVTIEALISQSVLLAFSSFKIATQETLENNITLIQKKLLVKMNDLLNPPRTFQAFLLLPSIIPAIPLIWAVRVISLCTLDLTLGIVEKVIELTNFFIPSILKISSSLLAQFLQKVFSKNLLMKKVAQKLIYLSKYKKNKADEIYKFIHDRRQQNMIFKIIESAGSTLFPEECG